MPELPEVEVIRRSLAEQLTGRTLASVTVLSPHVLVGGASSRLQSAVGQRVERVGRLGKCLEIHLIGEFIPAEAKECESRSNTQHGHSWCFRRRVEYTFLIHLRMTGRLLWNPAFDALDQHTHLIWSFASASGERAPNALVYRDVRKFGRVDLVENGKMSRSSMVEKFGPDVLSVSFDDFSAHLTSRRQQIKAVLLNQHVMAGLGNIYADEILFDAAIHPKTISADINETGMKRLFDSLRRILDEAISSGGSTIRDYLHTDGRGGNFQEQHKVYQRAGETCFRCGGLIVVKKIAGRSSSYCPACQRLEKAA